MIPSGFNILNHKIEVIYNNEFCSKNDCFGIFVPEENKIILANKYKTKRGWRKYKQEIINHAFYHELVHCILYYMNHELWDNEVFVDQFSGLLAQCLQNNK
jgi:hypothetical protein